MAAPPLTPRKFKALRKRLKLTQGEYGYLYGLVYGQAKISQMESGRADFSNQIVVIYEYLKHFGPLPEDVLRNAIRHTKTRGKPKIKPRYY